MQPGVLVLEFSNIVLVVRVRDVARAGARVQSRLPVHGVRGDFLDVTEDPEDDTQIRVSHLAGRGRQLSWRGPANDLRLIRFSGPAGLSVEPRDPDRTAFVTENPVDVAEGSRADNPWDTDWDDPWLFDDGPDI